MPSIFYPGGIFLLGLLLSFTVQAEKPILVIYTYDSFVSDWGPGPLVKTAFEKQCDCQLDMVGLEDGVSLLNRLRLEGRQTKADVVLGIDTSLTAEARATGLFEAHGLQVSQSRLAFAWKDDMFLPYDYGYFAFVYNRELLPAPPSSLKQLVDSADGPDILIQDPRSSTPGLGLLLWMKKVFGDRSAQAWARLSPRIVTVSKGWSESYGLFLKGEAPMVLSYSTSPAYHVIAEQDNRFAAAKFSEGHYQQIEVAGLLKSSRNKKLARQFLTFMLSEEFQRIIPTTNWMFPVALEAPKLPAPFRQLIDPRPALLFGEEEVVSRRKAWINEWLEAMSK